MSILGGMIVTVTKWGNSLGLRIPRGVAEDLQIAEGSAVDIHIEKGKAILEPVRSPVLDELLARVTDKNRHHDQFASTPIGREAL